MLHKILLYLTADALRVHHWRRGVLSDGPVYGHVQEDADALAAYLAAYPGVLVFVIADLVEEDFQRQLLPHVRGRVGRRMVERRLAQHYRDTPFRHAAIQEREEEGRRDDHALFSALTNAALLQPWIAAIEQVEAPLAGVYSASYLCGLLARRLAAAQPHLLLITEQAGGLRQTYFQGPWLKFSRLTVLGQGEDMVGAAAAETARMQQFLTSTRLLERGGMLQVLILAHAERLPALEAACEDGPETSFHFMSLDQAALESKLAEAPASTEDMLLDLVGRHPPPGQYALPSPRRFYRIWQGRIGLNAASALVVLVSGLWLLGDAWSIVDANGSARRMLADAARDDAQYRAAVATFPASAVPSANMKAAVLLDSQLATQAPAPDQMASLVSRALEAAPQVRLLLFDWKAGLPSATAAAGTPDQMPGAGGGVEPIPAALIGLPAAPPQTLRIEGEVTAAPSDYRLIVANIQRFAAEMARQPGVAVEILESPVDVRQNVTLSGRTGGQDPAARPRFVMRVTWKP